MFYAWRNSYNLIQSLVYQNQTASCHITVAGDGPVTNISGLQRQILLNHKMSIQYRDTVISVFTVFNRTWVAIESHYNCCDSILTIAVMFYRGAVWAHPVPPKREGCDSTGFGLLWGYVIVVYVRPHVQHNIRSMYKQNYACLYVYTMFRLSAKICLLEDWTAKKHMKWDFFKWDPNNTWRWFVLWLKSDFYKCISVGLSGRS